MIFNTKKRGYVDLTRKCLTLRFSSSRVLCFSNHSFARSKSKWLV